MTEVEPTVYVVDDDDATQRAIKALLRSVGLKVSAYSSGNELLKNCEFSTPGCILLDVRIPSMSGLQIQRELSKRGVDLPVIFVSGYAEFAVVVQAMKAGAVDFLEKPFSEQMLLDVVQQAIEKHLEGRRLRSSESSFEARFRTLTPRERQVVALVLNGKPSKEIAADLNITRKTVDIHRSHAMKKVGAKNAAELAQLALRARPSLAPRTKPSANEAILADW